MAPREPTRAQLSSKLSYQSTTPAFLLKLQNRIAGVPDEEQDDEEFEYVGAGREPIPKRPAIPERPTENPGSADEDDGDEKPQVVVLRKGKHLTQREVDNVKRTEKGLPALPDPEEIVANLKAVTPDHGPDSVVKPQTQGLSFSSSSKATNKAPGKRKALNQPDGDPDDKTHKKSLNKRTKKLSKTLLSFADET